MFKSKLAKTLIALIAVVIVAIAVPAALGANNAQASDEQATTATQRQNDKLSAAQRKLVKAANDEAAAATGQLSVTPNY
ncbi:hypothetical protein KB236_10575 [Levilactobacillus brevis]|nr:hypothetical protein KB236_10575 [Levilactobacillus brevis]